MQHVATHCNTLQHTSICLCNVCWLQNTATLCDTLQHTTTHCNTLHNTTTHCKILQRTTAHCNTLQHTSTHYNTLQHTWMCLLMVRVLATTDLQHSCNALQHIATHYNTLQHTATHVYVPFDGLCAEGLHVCVCMIVCVCACERESVYMWSRCGYANDSGR